MALTNAQAGLISSGVEAASSLGAQMLANNRTRKENARNRAFAASQAAQARQWQIEQWNMENEYNSPAAQMQRYIDAGLNPNLIYGDVGAGLGASAPSVPQGDAVPGQVPPTVFAGASLDAVQRGMLMDAQIDALKSQSGLDLARAKEILGDTPFAQANLQNIMATTARLHQQYNLYRVEELKQISIAEEVQNDQDVMVVTNPDGSTWQATPKEVYEFFWSLEFFKRTDFNVKEAENAVKLLLNKVQLSNFEVTEADLNNKDLRAWVNACSEYYNGLASEQTALGSMASDDARFVARFGGREAFRAISGTAEKLLELPRYLFSFKKNRR